MYRRNNISKGFVEREYDEHNRARNVIWNFRVTADEKNKIERRIALSGLNRQEYLIQSLMRQKVLCLGNVKTFDEMKKQLFLIEEHLRKVRMEDELDGEILESLRMILELYNGLNKVTDEDVYEPIRKSKRLKESGIIFADKDHENFYYRVMYEYDKKGGIVDCYSQPVFYLLGMHTETRNHFSLLFDMEKKEVNIDELYQEWQSEETRKICAFAFFLWNGFCGKCTDEEIAIKEKNIYWLGNSFDVRYEKYFWQAMCMRYMRN